MKSSKIEQPKGIIAGACFLLATFSMFILVQLAYGNAPFANLLNSIIYPYGFADVLESITWLLVFPAGIFAGISAITGNTTLTSISLLVFGGLNLLDCLISIIAFEGGWKTMIVTVLPVAVILAGITLLTDNPNLKLITTICAAIGLLTDVGRRIYLVRDYYIGEYLSLGRCITSGGAWIIAMALIAAAIVILVYAKKQTAPAGAMQNTYATSQPMAAQTATLRCPNCGTIAAPGNVFCGNCGSKIEPVAVNSAAATANAAVNSAAATPNNYSYGQPSPSDASSMGYAVLGFFFPVVGLVLYLVWKDQLPLRAKSAGKGAIAGAITGVVFTIIYTVAMVAMMANY